MTISSRPAEVSTRGLAWRTTTVAGRPATYAVAGQGRPLLFLHGWGLTHRSYENALRRLVRAGTRVYAPALPGFGGTAELPPEDVSLAGYTRWLDDFLTAMRIEVPVIVVGHSFGGGLAIQFAHDLPKRVANLVLINSIGGSAWSALRPMRDRPLWNWGLHMPADLLSQWQLTRVLPVILADAVPNLLRNPRTLWRVGHLARTADLTSQLTTLKQRRLPVVILWGQRDGLLPLAAVESLRTALGDPRLITVQGSHNWLLADPDGFGEMITNVITAFPAATDGAGAADDQNVP